ncbi:Aste57867_5005 [Aphanomyces stellatus]|uniref:peptidylprolyl isomerase n=1 Tax=Aphanomyces stellatus TaxID=120398 RepID=A0A485KDL6_9STRA|nr:hypothetical protein As57867_004992 [Aphanomyces stellatus]VFT82089.1 Aste57867_5005 [Aphanomyces stellatus]
MSNSSATAVPSAATLFSPCPTNPTAAACVVYVNQTTKVITTQGLQFAAPGMGITIVNSLPSSASIIDLSSNGITTIPTSALPLSVTDLNLSGNPIKTLSGTFASFSTLTAFRVANAQITDVRDLVVPDALKLLDLSGNPITTFQISSATRDSLNDLITKSHSFKVDPFTLAACDGRRDTLANGLSICLVEPSKSTSMGTIWLEIVGAAAGLVVLTLLYFCCVRKMLSHVYNQRRAGGRHAAAAADEGTGVGSAYEEALDVDPTGGVTFVNTVVGKGQEAVRGSKVQINYVGKLASTGKQFDANASTIRPFKFQVGAGDVVPGMDVGVEGMLEGGTRVVQIPSKMGYGAHGAGDDIPPHADLVFEIRLLKVVPGIRFAT